MKRVGRPASAPAVRPQQAAAVEAAAEDPEEIQRASRRRLNSFVPPAYDAELELAGSPPSRAEVVNIMIRAKGMFVSFYSIEFGALAYRSCSQRRKLLPPRRALQPISTETRGQAEHILQVDCSFEAPLPRLLLH